MNETSDIKLVVQELKSRPLSIIAIDGIDGAGKTTFSKKLQRRFKCERIGIDKYRNNKSGGYINYIRYDQLKKKLSNAARPILIEGACVLAVLERLEEKPDFIVYVKRYSKCGYWQDENKCNVEGDINFFVNQEKEQSKMFAEVEAEIEGNEFDRSFHVFPLLKEELIRYHYKYRPFEKADIVYKRIERKTFA